MDIVNGVIQVLDQLKKSGQLNNYLIDDDERKWTKLVYDIMVNKFDMPFGKSTMQQASEVFNNAVRIWKGKNKVGNMMNMESKQTNKKLIRLTESDLHRIVNESVKRILSEGKYVFHSYIEGEGNFNTLIDDPNQVKPYIERAKYWDITKGMNSSDPQNLVAWGGEGGPWNNFLEKPEWAKEGVHWNRPSERMIQLVLSKKKN